MKGGWHKNEVIIEKKTKKVVCVQKPEQYYYTIPNCKKGSIGGYCIIRLSKTLPKSKIPKKSCRKIHLTVNDAKKKTKRK